MTKTIFAVYERKSTLPHYCRSAWIKALHIIRIECYFADYSEEREEQYEIDAITYKINRITGVKEEITVDKLFPDRYVIETTNVRGVKARYSYRTKDEANAAFLNIKSKFKGFQKVR